MSEANERAAAYWQSVLRREIAGERKDERLARRDVQQIRADETEIEATDEKVRQVRKRRVGG